MRQEIGNEQEYLEDLKERSQKRVDRETEIEEQQAETGWRKIVQGAKIIYEKQRHETLERRKK